MEKRWRYGVRGLADNVTATTPNCTVTSGLQAGAELVILMYHERVSAAECDGCDEGH